MSPPTAAAQVEDDVLPPPCSIHDDRLRSLETEQAAQGAQLAAGTEMFRAIQDSIKDLNASVRDTMNRVESRVDEVARDVKGINEKVSQVQVKQASHDGQLQGITDQHTREREAVKDRRKFWVNVGIRVGIPVLTLTLATVATKSGRTLLGDILRAIGAGG